MPLSLKHPAMQDLPRKLPREFLGQWQDVVETPDYRLVKEIEIREAGQVQTISGMAELKHKGKSGISVCYYPTFALREERPRRLKAWFEVSTAIECHAGGASVRTPSVGKILLRMKITGSRLKFGALEGEFTSEGLHFHVAQTNDLVGGYKKIG